MADSGGEFITLADAQDSSPLRLLAERVAEYGLEIREHSRGGELTEIAVTSPQDPGLGRVVMDRDGFLTWERFCKFQTADDIRAAAQVVRVLLDEGMSTRLDRAASAVKPASA